MVIMSSEREKTRPKAETFKEKSGIFVFDVKGNIQKEKFCVLRKHIFDNTIWNCLTEVFTGNCFQIWKSNFKYNFLEIFQ